ncbi:hypothetical protein FQA39_LY13554 [Lamprigera yunnana]|nr:hypothetical protein FQA39_LY13554 [Lamprigera yunnana]
MASTGNANKDRYKEYQKNYSKLIEAKTELAILKKKLLEKEALQNDEVHAILLLRAGFVLIQLGSIPSANVYVILYQNVVNIATTIASFGSIGYTIAFGEDLKGVIGYNKWFIYANSSDINNAIVGFLATLIATGIITTVICSRMHSSGYFFTIFLLSAIIQPAIIHWVWNTEGWLYYRDFMDNEVSFRDQSGGLIIHAFAGMVSLVCDLFFGRRLLLLSNISELSIGVEAPGSSFVGYTFVILGLMGFSFTSFSYGGSLKNYSEILIINNLSAIAGGILAVVVLQCIFFKRSISYWNILRCMQGGLAGIVSVAPGVDIYTPEISFGIAAVSSIIFYCFAMFVMHKTSIEDYCNVISVHLVCGIIGLLLPPLLGKSDIFVSKSIQTRLIYCLWQISTFTVLLFVLVCCTNLCLVLILCRKWRSSDEQVDHLRSVIAATNQEQKKPMIERIFTETADSLFIEPGPSNRNLTNLETDKKKPISRVHRVEE